MLIKSSASLSNDGVFPLILCVNWSHFIFYSLSLLTHHNSFVRADMHFIFQNILANIYIHANDVNKLFVFSIIEYKKYQNVDIKCFTVNKFDIFHLIVLTHYRSKTEKICSTNDTEQM